MTPARVFERIAERVVAGPNGCHVSTYSVGSHGYSQIGWHFSGRRTMALGHRVAYEAAHGPIPHGMTVDHACRNRRCVNPDHLRLMSNIDNAKANGNAVRTHCKRGHAFGADNTYMDGRGHRRCRSCIKGEF